MASSSKAANDPAVIDLDAAHLTLGTAAAKVKILKGINLQIGAGETVGVLGPSGAGKTSLLMVLAGLETLTQGASHWPGPTSPICKKIRLPLCAVTWLALCFRRFG